MLCSKPLDCHLSRSGDACATRTTPTFGMTAATAAQMTCQGMVNWAVSHSCSLIDQDVGVRALVGRAGELAGLRIHAFEVLVDFHQQIRIEIIRAARVLGEQCQHEVC